MTTGDMSTSGGLPVFDGHNDVLLRLIQAGNSDGSAFFQRGERGHLDLPRAIEGGFGGGFFAIFIPDDVRAVPDPNSVIDITKPSRLPPPLDPAYALGVAMTMVALLFRIETRSEGRLKVVRDAQELETCLRSGVLAAIMHFEGAEAIDADLESLEVFYQAGLRSLGPVWSRRNVFGEGVPFAFGQSPDTGPGLTERGVELLRTCNRLGVLFDLSHLNEQGFWDVARLSTAPLVATHSNAHALCPSTRNLTDKQLDAIKESDGMVGVNLATAFLRDDGRNDPDTPIEVVVRHVDYLVERLGPDRVGLGTDFDGATIPRQIGDVSGLPLLISALQERGYDASTLRKLAYENWLRVLRKTWK
ncbi:MAG: dipeptidase [Chloroflexia bacterium]